MRRTEAEPREPNPPRTLAQASEVLWHLRPGERARLADWVVYYQRLAVIYDGIAETDQDHHHEARYLTGQAHERAREIETRNHETQEHH
ncbi:MAG: hypothetical protein JO115_14560 [Pseudonocardiales bacterium]|nr:hypothetical protein [Pseudonocardiales bacterium]